MELIIDKWLSDRLGKPAWNLVGSLSPDERLPVLPQGAFFTAKVSGADVHGMMRLTREGFYPVTVSVGLLRSSAQPMLPLQMRNVRGAVPNDWKDIYDIAFRSFTYDRFHVDPSISSETADRIKAQWALQGCAEAFADPQSFKMLVSVSLGYPTGFLLMKKREERWALDLVGVHPYHQNRGIGKALVNEFLIQAGPVDTVVFTQITNTASLKLYLQAGFEIVESKYVLHRHS